MARRSRSAQATGQIGTIPAPIGGWNVRDAMPAMPVTDAIVLDNLIPSTGALELRSGYASHVTGLGSAVQSLMEYNSPSGTQKLFGAAGTAIYDVTTAGAVGAGVVTGLTNAQWQHTMFSTSAGNYLVACNGADSVRNYDGTSWTTPSITGATSSTLIAVAVYGSQLWFAQKNTLDAWYLPTSAIAGAATKFPLGSLCKKGGSLLAIATWTRDGGSGSDDLIVFITTRGEVLLYSGTPATTFRIVGVFSIPEPIGRRCAVKIGADVGIVTSAGAVSLSQVLPSPSTEQGSIAVTDKIKGAFADAYASSGSLFGWQIIEWPRKSIAIVNVPQGAGTTAVQFVLHAASKGWCRFTGINALCWSLLSDALYFGGSNGKVYRMANSNDDDGVPITAIVMPAFSNFGSPFVKQFTMAQAIIDAVAGTTPPLNIRTNYDTSPSDTFAANVPSSGSPWDTSPWDTSSWGAGIEPLAEWQVVGGIGQVGTVIMTTTSRNPLKLSHINVLFERGGVL